MDKIIIYILLTLNALLGGLYYDSHKELTTKDGYSVLEVKSEKYICYNQSEFESLVIGIETLMAKCQRTEVKWIR